MFVLTEEILLQIAPTLPKGAYAFVPYLNQVFKQYAINTPERLACFLAQTAHESGGFRYTTELASGKEYEDRNDLGNTEPGDGPLYKGRGLIQITGKYNYLMCSEALYPDDRGFLIKHPDQLSTPRNACFSAGWYWQHEKLNDICELPDTWTTVHNGKTYNRFEWLTLRINGGLNGLDSRLAYYGRAKAVISSQSA